MADSKKYDGSQWEHSLRKLTTATEAVVNPLYSDGTAITSYTIKGNTVQSGTPTPSNPVEVQGVGNKTANLCDLSSWTNQNTDTRSYFQIVVLFMNDNTQLGKTSNIYVHTTGEKAISFNVSYANCNKLQIKHNGSTRDLFITNILGEFSGDYTLSFDCLGTNPTAIDGIKLDKIMLNTGTSALPYEPYGQYKIPISSGGVTANIYLNEPLMKVDDSADSKSNTTEMRAIYKYEFKGTELWSLGTSQVFISRNNLQSIPEPLAASALICSHFPNDNTGIINGNTWFFQVFGYSAVASDIATWQQYLAQQYAAGTPVTVWYILATPTTEQITLPSIPTTDGANTITVDTTVQPSEFSATWTGWHDSSVKEYDGTGWQ